MALSEVPHDLTGSGYTSRYEVLSQKKEVYIYPSGYGLVRFETTLLVTDASFAGPLHYVGVDQNVPKEHTLPSVAQMQAVDFDNAPPKPFINYILLKPRHRGFRITPMELPTQRVRGATTAQVEEGRVRAFLFEISPRCVVGQELTYSWEWGFPDLFCMSSGAEESSSYECLSPVRHLEIDLRFLHRNISARQLFHKQPILEIARSGEGKKGLSLEAPPVEELRAISYSWVFGNAQIGDRLVLHWTIL